ncbi:hypothetical protein BC832DRAFT_60661 [Gaertneriomyces semiglobifer]|nr:hypothetical protein BC832DRAFT_60661 [Gaertneriomyces semiglobifer]
MATFASTVAAQAPLATCGAQDACTSPAVCVTVGTAKTCYLPPTATCTVVAQENCISGVCTPGDLTCAKSANTKPCRTAGDCSATGATCTAGVCTAGEAQTPAAGAAGGACLAGRNCTTAATTFCVGQGEEAKCLLKYDQACTTATAAHCMSGTCTSEKCARSDENEGCTTNTDCTPDTLVCQRPTGAATTVAGTCKPAGAHGQPCTRELHA